MRTSVPSQTGWTKKIASNHDGQPGLKGPGFLSQTITQQEITMLTAFIVAQWNEGLISTGEALAKIMTDTHDSDVAKWESIAAISLKLMEQEQAAAETAEPGNNYYEDDYRHGPHGKRCLCSECTAADYADTEDQEERDYLEALIEDAERSKNES
jgi:hypothetical protein